MAKLQIIGAPQSNFVWGCRIVCGEKGVPYELTAAFPHTPVVDAIHPYGKIPAMRHGDVTLCESRAIYYYIDHAFPGTPLSPRDPVGGAQVEQWLSLVNTTIDPVLLRQYGIAYFFPGTPDGSPNRTAIDAVLPKTGDAFPAARPQRGENRPSRRIVSYSGRRQPRADPLLHEQVAGERRDARPLFQPEDLSRPDAAAALDRGDDPATDAEALAGPEPLLLALDPRFAWG